MSYEFSSATESPSHEQQIPLILIINSLLPGSGKSLATTAASEAIPGSSICRMSSQIRQWAEENGRPCATRSDYQAASGAMPPTWSTEYILGTAQESESGVAIVDGMRNVGTIETLVGMASAGKIVLRVLNLHCSPETAWRNITQTGEWDTEKNGCTFVEFQEAYKADLSTENNQSEIGTKQVEEISEKFGYAIGLDTLPIGEGETTTKNEFESLIAFCAKTIARINRKRETNLVKLNQIC